MIKERIFKYILLYTTLIIGVWILLNVWTSLNYVISDNFEKLILNQLFFALALYMLYLTLKLYKGNVIVSGRKSVYSLYSPELATFEQDEIYDHADAKGFIKLFALPAKVWGKLHKK